MGTLLHNNHIPERLNSFLKHTNAAWAMQCKNNNNNKKINKKAPYIHRQL